MRRWPGRKQFAHSYAFEGETDNAQPYSSHHRPALQWLLFSGQGQKVAAWLHATRFINIPPIKRIMPIYFAYSIVVTATVLICPTQADRPPADRVHVRKSL